MAGEDGGTDHVDRLLAQWASERPDLDTRPLEIAARIARLDHFVVRTSRAALEHFGLSEADGNVLAALRRSGAPYRLTPSELTASLLVSSGAMTNRIDGLETRGLVRRVDDPDDRRRVQVTLTEAGREVIDEAMDTHVDALAGHLDLPDETHARVVDGLRRLLLRFEGRG